MLFLICATRKRRIGIIGQLGGGAPLRFGQRQFDSAGDSRRLDPVDPQEIDRALKILDPLIDGGDADDRMS